MGMARRGPANCVTAVMGSHRRRRGPCGTRAAGLAAALLARRPAARSWPSRCVSLPQCGAQSRGRCQTIFTATRRRAALPAWESGATLPVHCASCMSWRSSSAESRSRRRRTAGFTTYFLRSCFALNAQQRGQVIPPSRPLRQMAGCWTRRLSEGVAARTSSGWRCSTTSTAAAMPLTWQSQVLQAATARAQCSSCSSGSRAACRREKQRACMYIQAAWVA
mmetsp:Transcript_17522/g.54189  ORF Transcript_17522/g.54189 Transcript_17522/m.54189 type:complete len:221 (-) Transcript_17522:303-965(-)